MAIEDIQYQMNPEVHKILAELLGVIENNLYEKKYEYIIVPSKTWKSVCGISGRKRQEQKENTIKFVKQQFGIEVEEDIADAICIGWGTILKYKL